MLVRFLRFSFRFFRFCWRSALSPFSLSGGVAAAYCVVVAVPFWLSVFAALLPWLLVCLFLRRLFFVRFRRPLPLVGPWRSWLGVGGCGWRCVPASALPSVRAFFGGSLSGWVFPAVVCRRSGLVLWVWVWCPPGWRSETERQLETEAKTETEKHSSAANAASEKARILASNAKLGLRIELPYRILIVTASLILRKNRNTKQTYLTIPP